MSPATLYMMHLRPNLRHLVPWALRQGLVPDKGQGDLGYAFHAALKAAFGDLAPQPFSYRNDQGLLAYSRHDEALLTAASTASPEMAAMLCLDATPSSAGLLIRPFPQHWKAGQTLSFAVRVRPVVRKEDKEVDAFLSTAQRTPDATLSREAVYAEWLRRQFAAAADIHAVQMNGFSLSSVLRRGASSAGGHRPAHPVLGPDAEFSGTLRVKDPDSFAALVSRGIGRHRAFGFGMLLLRPANMGSWG